MHIATLLLFPAQLTVMLTRLATCNCTGMGCSAQVYHGFFLRFRPAKRTILYSTNSRGMIHSLVNIESSKQTGPKKTVCKRVLGKKEEIELLSVKNQFISFLFIKQLILFFFFRPYCNMQATRMHQNTLCIFWRYTALLSKALPAHVHF